MFRSIQTSWETNWNAQITSATSIEFADLGARLAELDSWTVEFFFKFDVLRMTNKGAYQTYQYNVRFGEDERIYALLQSQPDSLGNGIMAARFAALRVTDRVLSAKELLRASDIPPDDKALETSFHWTFESNATGASLGTVPNEALWRVRYGTPSRTSIHTPWCIAWRTPATTAARPYASSLITRSARP